MIAITGTGTGSGSGTLCSGCGTLHPVGQCVPAPEVVKAAPVATGWRCPCCLTVWAPSKDRCATCTPMIPHFRMGSTA